MTTEQTEQPEDASEDFTDEGPRAHMKAVEAENKNLREQVLTGHIEAIGLETKTGLGVAVFEGYKGEFTAEAVAEYAKEKFGYEHVEGDPAAPAAEELETKEAAVAAVTDTSTPVTPTTRLSDIEELDNALADPEVDGPVVGAMAIEKKLQAYVAGEFRGKQIP